MVLAVCVTIAVIVLIIVGGKCIRQCKKQKHELDLEEKKWTHKKELEDTIANYQIEEIKKELQVLKNELAKKRDKDKGIPDDLIRLAMLHLFLSGQKPITGEKLQKEIDNVKNMFKDLKL